MHSTASLCVLLSPGAARTALRSRLATLRSGIGAALGLLALLAAPTLPAQTAPAPTYFVVVDQHERFIFQLTDPAKIETARKMMRGDIPTPGWFYGRLAEGGGGYNCDFGNNRRWTWHLVPDSIDFPEITAEALQTLPSFIEEDKDYWINTLGACAIGGKIESEGLVFRPGQFVVHSAHSWVGGGDDAQITGFVITGSGLKSILLRANGPALSSFGETDLLPDPVLELREALTGRLVAINDNWSSDSAAAEAIAAATTQVGATPWERGSKDAALLVTLPPGCYTAITRGTQNGTGFALTEVHQTDGITRLRRVNISVRSSASNGGKVQVAGFVISGVEEKRLLIRGLGPTLAGRGLSAVLADPLITLYDERDHHELATNDNWDDLGTLDEDARSELENVTAMVGATPLPANSRDAALLVTVEPGSYTVVLSGVADSTGLALLEIFEVSWSRPAK